LATACFQYVPADVPPVPPPQTEVRVTLATPLDITMGEFTLNGVTRLEGVVAEGDDQGVSLVARWLYPSGGRKYDAQYGSYDVPLQQIQQLEVWRFSPRRTLILGGLVTGAAAVLLRVIWRVARGDTFDPPRADPS
jgi:hypothetical protein